MNKELYELYLEGFEKDYWDKRLNGNFANDRSDEWRNRIEFIEDKIFGYELDGPATTKLEEFQAAKKQWDKISASPLYKALG